MSTDARHSPKQKTIAWKWFLGLPSPRLMPGDDPSRGSASFTGICILHTETRHERMERSRGERDCVHAQMHMQVAARLCALACAWTRACMRACARLLTCADQASRYGLKKLTALLVKLPSTHHNPVNICRASVTAGMPIHAILQSSLY